MSKVIYACYKDRQLNSSIIEDIQAVSAELMPDNISPNPVKTAEKDGIVYGIINPLNVVEEKNSSILLGRIFGDDEEWWVPGKKVPDGSYALFRGGEDTIELISDAAGSRSIWYYHDEERFIASTSQRAIVGLL